MKDPIVEEVRKARQDHAREFNHDLTAICNDLKRIERDCGHKLVSLPPRLIASPLPLKTLNREPWTLLLTLLL